MRRRDPERTRKKLVQAAFWEIYRLGFHRARLDAILEGTGVTKGALYHHFPGKRELGYAVVDEVIRPWILNRWLSTSPGQVQTEVDPLDELAATARRVVAQASEEAVRCGCPLNNLVQEMAPLDEGFRRRLQAVMDDWRDGVSQALEMGQSQGTVRRDVEPKATALVVVATLEGLASLTKCSQSRETALAALEGLDALLDGLRAPGGVGTVLGGR